MSISLEKGNYMKKEIGTDSTVADNNKTCDIETDSINDIIERIEGLSYEGQRQIIAYLKTKIAKSRK